MLDTIVGRDLAGEPLASAPSVRAFIVTGRGFRRGLEDGAELMPRDRADTGKVGDAVWAMAAQEAPHRAEISV